MCSNSNWLPYKHYSITTCGSHLLTTHRVTKARVLTHSFDPLWVAHAVLVVHNMHVHTYIVYKKQHNNIIVLATLLPESVLKNLMVCPMVHASNRK